MSIAALIFDFDGTLADTEEAHRQAFNAAFLEHSLFWNWSAPRYGELLSVSGGKERILAYVESLQASAEEKARLAGIAPLVHRTKTRIFAELMESGGVPLRPGIARLLREAHERGVRLAIASTTTATNVEALLTATLTAESRGWFDVIACGDIVPAKKPAPDIYELALASLRLPPDACVAIEDSAKGLRAARAAGLRTVVTPTYWTTSDDFAGAAAVLPGLGDPDAPLDSVTQRVVGAPYVGLAELARLVGDDPTRAAA
jgi:HAD superfamily hydrolase (TIGR01509 family)